jgi:hypothetical protein
VNLSAVSEGPSQPEPTWRLGPLQVKRTTDVLAFVAFILSAIGLLAQLRDYFRGPNVVLFATEQVDIASTPAWNQFFRGQNFVLFGAGMSYVNSAPTGYNAAIRREWLRFVIDGVEYQYAAHEYVDTLVVDGKFKPEKKGDAGPFALLAGGSVTHEVLFLPRAIVCADNNEQCRKIRTELKWDDFKAAVQKNPVIKITTGADVYGMNLVSATCTLTIGKKDLDTFEASNWSSPDCHEAKPAGFLERLIQ